MSMTSMTTFCRWLTYICISRPNNFSELWISISTVFLKNSIWVEWSIFKSRCPKTAHDLHPFSHPQTCSLLVSSISVNGNIIQTVMKAKTLGVTFDAFLPFNFPFQSISKTSWFLSFKYLLTLLPKYPLNSFTFLNLCHHCHPNYNFPPPLNYCNDLF